MTIARCPYSFYNFLMPKIQLSVPHQLGQGEARTRISKLIAESRVKFGDKVTDLTETWTGYVDAFSFRTMGFDIDGRLEVEEFQVMIDINFPWLALPFKGQVENAILKHARELLA
jgi:hypothetical protein